MNLVNLKEYVADPGNRKQVTGALVGICVFFLLLLVSRSCRRPDAETVGSYLQNLSSREAGTRIDAALGLARLGATRTAPEVERLFTSDPDERVRRAAAYALLVLDRPGYLDYLETEDDALRLLALETIARTEKENALAFMERGLGDRAAKIRETSFNLLDRFGGRRAIAIFERLAENTDADEQLRARALAILARRGGPDVLELLGRLAGSDPSRQVRDAAAGALRIAEERLRP